MKMAGSASARRRVAVAKSHEYRCRQKSSGLVVFDDNFGKFVPTVDARLREHRS